MQVPTHLIRDSLFVQCETVIDKKVFKSNFFIIHIAGEYLGGCEGAVWMTLKSISVVHGVVVVLLSNTYSAWCLYLLHWVPDKDTPSSRTSCPSLL